MLKPNGTLKTQGIHQANTKANPKRATTSHRPKPNRPSTHLNFAIVWRIVPIILRLHGPLIPLA
jgi:hypothetical protein